MKQILTILCSVCTIEGYARKAVPTDTTAVQDTVINLGSIVVRGSLPLTQIKGDALVTRVQNSVLSKVGALENLLPRIPGIRKTHDGFEVAGKGEPLVYIDGRKMTDKAELQRLNAADIKSVEVVANPGARYDASVGAVVRINTIRRRGDGFSVELSSKASRSQNTDIREMVAINFRHKGLDIFTNVGYMENRDLDVARVQTTLDTSYRWENDIHWKWHQTVKNLSAILGTNYRFNDRHSIGIKYTRKFYPSFGTVNQSDNTVRKDSAEYDFLHNDTRTSRDYKYSHLVNGYYYGKVKGFTLDFNTDFFHEKYTDADMTRETSRDYDSRTIRYADHIKNRMLATRLNVSHALGGGNLNFGGEGTFTQTDDDYASEAEEYLPSENSRIRENNLAAFVEYNRTLGKALELSAGLRYEHVDFNYYEHHVLQKEQSRTYDNFFPSLSLHASWGGGLESLLSYAVKTQRPSYRELSNNYTYQSRFAMNQGNPLLRPSYTHDITLQNSWRFIQLELDYQRLQKPTVMWGETKAGQPDNIIFVRPLNYKDLSIFSASLSIAPRIGLWSPDLYLQLDKQWLTAEMGGRTHSFNKPHFWGTFQNIWSLPHGWDVELDGYYQGKGYTLLNYSTKDYVTVDAALRKAFFKDRLQAELSASDLFYTIRSGVRVYENLLSATQNNRYDTRAVTLTLTYRLNTTSSHYKGTGAGQKELQRF